MKTSKSLIGTLNYGNWDEFSEIEEGICLYISGVINVFCDYIHDLLFHRNYRIEELSIEFNCLKLMFLNIGYDIIELDNEVMYNEIILPIVHDINNGNRQKRREELKLRLKILRMN
ncbi:hypothetical protein D9V86_09985 [Bacteroidetes/Chlorobi group bacterium ChocPot_Mid]|nr:MAG: hypothetical protein D9V86_09985 [Bacteroidetes/Chlorobi group bacterium ChocPot_Mid]